MGELGEYPISFGYVYSGSMKPVLKPGDGFVVVKAAEFQTGDVIVFEPETLGHRYVTHRIVAVTPDGRFITRGDNSPLSDQQANEPPVATEQIRGKLLTVGGSVVAIPWMGTAAGKLRQYTQGIGRNELLLIIAAAAAVILAIDMVSGQTSRSRTEQFRLLDIAPYADPVFWLFVVFMFVGGGFGALTVGAWQTAEASYVAVDQPGLRSPMVGTEFQQERQLKNTSLLTYRLVLSPENTDITVEPRSAVVGPGETFEYTVDLTAPQETGHYVENIAVRAYPAVMPATMFDNLYDSHYGLPLAVSFAPVVLVLLAVGVWWYRRWNRDRARVMNWMVRRRRQLRQIWQLL
jgi:signal peptidase